LFAFTPEEDQAAAGAIMWVVGSLAFILPAIVIAIECLSRRRAEVQVSLSTRPKGSAKDASSHPRAKKQFARRLNSRAFEAASFVTLFVMIAAAFVVLSSHASDDDDQVLRLSRQEGPFAISIYGPAGELSRGPATFGVLVQDRSSRAVLLDSEVHFILRDPAGKDLPVTIAASPRDENRLLFAANPDLDTPGARIFDITVQNANRNVIVSMPLKIVAATESGFALHWSYVVIVAVSVLLCLAYFWRHRTSKPAGLAAPVA
jgi:hypothetical protein